MNTATAVGTGVCRETPRSASPGRCRSARSAGAAPPRPHPRDLAPHREREGPGSGRRRAAWRPAAPARPPAPSSPVGGQQRLVDQHDEEGAGPVEERRQQLGHPGGQPRGGGVRVGALGLAAGRHVPRPPRLPPPPSAALRRAPARPAPVPSPPAAGPREGAAETGRAAAAPSARPRRAARGCGADGAGCRSSRSPVPGATHLLPTDPPQKRGCGSRAALPPSQLPSWGATLPSSLSVCFAFYPPYTF